MSDTWLSDITMDLPPDEQILYDSLDEWMREHFYPLREGESIEFPMLGRKIAGMYLFVRCSVDSCGWRHRETLAREQINFDCDLRGVHLNMARTKNREYLKAHLHIEHSQVCRYCGESTVGVLHVGCVVEAVRAERRLQ